MQPSQAVTEADCIQALTAIAHLVASEPDRGAPNEDRLEALIALAEAFEADRHPLDLDDIAAR